MPHTKRSASTGGRTHTGAVGERVCSFGAVIGEISELSESAGLDGTVFETVMKITATAYITQNGASLLRDCGEGALSEKVELGGKVIILASALPSVKALFEVIVGLL